jgi:fatty acid amide hydrolase 2
MNPLLTLSATRLATMIREREITSLEVVETHIERATEVNPAINAIVVDRYDAARDEARAADKLTKKTAPEKLPPFHGVPCTIKESFALTGMPNTSGLVSRKNFIAQSDAVTVARLREAGGIPIGVTNVPELCMWMETNNRVYGRTNNPYDRSRIAGGSSGGEGAIIGAGASPFGLGADVGGSIRMPAFFNGIFGHKGTGGLVPNTGQYPIAANEALRYLSSGPMCRRAEDLMPLLRILAGPDGEDTGCEASVIGDPEKVSIKGMNVLNVVGNGLVPVSTDLQEAQGRVAEYLRSRGAQVRTMSLESLKRSFDIWGSMLAAAGGPTFSSMMAGETDKSFRSFLHLMRWGFRTSPHTLPALMMALLENLPKLTPKRTLRFIEHGKELRQELVNMIGPDGIMLYPSYSQPAPRHAVPLLRPFNFVYTGIINVMELPATQVPLGLNNAGIPLGCQVVSVHGNDHVTIAVAMELERAFGGWVPPPSKKRQWIPSGGTVHQPVQAAV